MYKLSSQTPGGRMNTRSISSPSSEKTPQKPNSNPQKPNSNPKSEIQQLIDVVKGLSDKVDMIDKKMDTMQTDIDTIKKSAEFATEQSTKALNKVNELEATVKSQNEVIEQQKKIAVENAFKYQKLNEKFLELETYSRRDNLIFHGVHQDDKETCAIKIKKLLRDSLQLDPQTVDDMCFQRCHRMPGKTKPTPIICRFANFNDRELVWSTRKKLKDTNLRISENFPDEIRNRRSALFPYMLAAIKADKKATLKYDKLLIEGQLYTVDSIKEMSLDFDPTAINTQTKNDVTCFFGSSSPLSNFHHASFVYKERVFSCVEEVFQLEKAKFAERPDIAQQIHMASRPNEMKQLGDSIKVKKDEWLPVAKNVAYKACLAKFSQNRHCRTHLLDTKDTILAESGPDRTWGTGIKMTEPDAFDKQKWPGENLLGNILMRIRKELTEGL